MNSAALAPVAPVLSWQSGKIALLARPGQAPIVGSIEDITTPAGVSVSTFHVQADGYATPVIPLEQDRVEIAITAEDLDGYYLERHRLYLAAKYVDFCHARDLALDRYATLNVVWALEAAGLGTPGAPQHDQVTQLMARTRAAFYSFLEALASRHVPKPLAG